LCDTITYEEDLVGNRKEEKRGIKIRSMTKGNKVKRRL